MQLIHFVFRLMWDTLLSPFLIPGCPTSSPGFPLVLYDPIPECQQLIIHWPYILLVGIDKCLSRAEGPVINNGEGGGLQKSRGASQVLPIQNKGVGGRAVEIL